MLVTSVPSDLSYTRSSFSGGGNCVEVAHAEGSVYVRNSRRPDSVLTFTPPEWAAFMEAVKSGSYVPAPRSATAVGAVFS